MLSGGPVYWGQVTYSLYRAGIDGEGLAFTYFVAAVWSFWDWSRAHQTFAEAMALRAEFGYDSLAIQSGRTLEFREPPGVDQLLQSGWAALTWVDCHQA
ncbi:hypothethical protein (plasmid) [Ralstonia solanacearum PSI07]|nr:hypothethical protein [Ralstonia solanacearum PSI07]